MAKDGNSVAGKPSRIEVKIETSHEYIKANSANRLYFLSSILAQKGQSASGPLNLALLIDASGSMSAEDKLEQAKEAAKMFVNGLKEDVLAVCSFSDFVREVVPAQVVSDKDRINSRIDAIKLEGGTALFQALRQVRDSLKRTKASGMANRLIVITDGCPTSDERMFTSDHEWRRYSEAFAIETQEKGIPITAIGVGSDYNETILSSLGAKSGGEFKHIRNAAELKGYLQEQLHSLQKLVADNCLLHIVTTPGSDCTVFSHRNVLPDGNDVKVRLGGLEEGTMEVAGEFMVAPRPPGTFRISKGLLEYDDPASGLVGARTAPVNVIARTTDSMDLIVKGRNARVIERVTTYRMAIDTLQAAKTGNVSEITRRIEELTRRPDLDSKTRKEFETMLIEARQTQRIDTKQLLSQTQRVIEGKQKEGEE